MTELTPRILRDLFGLFATGVVVVTAVDTQRAPIGLTVNSLTSVSLEPPLLLWCLAGTSQHCGAFAPGAAFDIHILGDDQTSLALHFARRSRDKFETDAAWRKEPTPPPIHGALARMSCRVHATHEAGDHVVIIGAIEDAERGAGEPLVFHAGKFGRFAPKLAAPDILPGSSDGWL